MDDNIIIELYLAKDAKAIQETALFYGNRLDRLAYGIVRNS